MIIPLTIVEENIKNAKDYYLIFALSYFMSYLCFKFKNFFIKGIHDKIKFVKILILMALLFAILIYIILIYIIIYYNKSYYSIAVSSIIISFMNIMNEIFITYLMSILIPIEKEIYKININNFMNSTEFFIFRPLTFLLVYLIYTFNNKNYIIILFIISFSISILQIIIYLIFNYRINYTSLTRIMNYIKYKKL